MQFAEDDIPFANILKAMGIENFEHSVPTALNEYAESTIKIGCNCFTYYSTFAKQPYSLHLKHHDPLNNIYDRVCS